VTAKSDHNAAGFRKLQKSGFNRLFVPVSFYTTKTVTNVTKVVTNCDFFTSSNNENGYRKPQNSFFQSKMVTKDLLK
jgi:hypothetical protein